MPVPPRLYREVSHRMMPTPEYRHSDKFHSGSFYGGWFRDSPEARRTLREPRDLLHIQRLRRVLSKGVREKGRAEGHTERALSDLRNLMETLGLTIEQAMAALKVPEAERQIYMDLLERQ